MRWDESGTSEEHGGCGAKSADSKIVKRNRLVVCSSGQHPFEKSGLIRFKRKFCRLRRASQNLELPVFCQSAHYLPWAAWIFLRTLTYIAPARAMDLL